jgi:hypothetical protein
MRAPSLLIALVLGLAVALPAPGRAQAAQAAGLSCAEIPAAENFVAGLHPGPNTRAAQRHLAAARRARTNSGCAAELRQVDRYAKASAAADRRAATHGIAGSSAPRGVRCADVFHQDRPGGSDYHGPRVRGCN